MPAIMKSQKGVEKKRPFSSIQLLGLGFWQAWWMLVLCSGAVLPYAYSQAFSFDPLLFVLGCSALGYLVAIVAGRWFTPFLPKRRFLVLSSVFSFTGTLGMGVSANGAFGDALVAPYVAATILFSLGNAWLLIMWGELWSTLATGRVGRFLYVSYAFAFVLFFTVNALPLAARVTAISFLPVISTLILKYAEREPRREPSAVPFAMEPVSLVKIFGYLVFMSMAYGVSQSAATVVGASRDYLASMFAFAGICIAALALNIFLRQPPVEAFALFRPIFPAMAIALVLIALLPGDLTFIGGGLAVLAAYCLDMLIMLVATDISFRRRMPVASTLGSSVFVARLGSLVGTVAARSVFFSEGVTAEFVSQVLLVTAIVVILVGTLVFSSADMQRLYRPRVPVPHSAETLNEKCERVSEMCGITAREREVLILLASGRSIPYISNELSIATGTTKHHVSSIYRKIGVCDRQSLHDVIEQGSAGKGAF